MKLIDKLDETNEKSLYSGRTTQNVEMYLRAIPTVDEQGNTLKQTQRYYVFRLLNFQTETRNYPFIVRNEHEYYRKDASGKILDVKRICCPSTPWAKSKINETVDRNYCPICKFSYEQNTEGWKNFKNNGQIDSMCLQISKDTKAKWAVYIPVLVVKDPSYDKNNNHLRVLRLSGDEGKSTFNRIRSCIAEANERGVNVFNGGEGANIAILCEKQKKFMVKKDGKPVIDPKTGEQRSYISNSVTDVRLLTNRLHSYQNITESEIEKLGFDETYNVPATRDMLNVFLNENYLDTGASDADFGDDFNESEFGDAKHQTTSVATAKVAMAKPSVNEDIESDEFAYVECDEPCQEEEQPSAQKKSDNAEAFTEDDIEDDFDESPKDMIGRITKNAAARKSESGKITMSNKVSMQQDTEKLRNESTSFDDDDLPF